MCSRGRLRASAASVGGAGLVAALVGCGSSVVLEHGEGGAGGADEGGQGGQGGQGAALSSCAIVDAAVGNGHRCALAEDGTVWCWGAWLRLGTCESEDSAMPRRVPLPQPATDIAAGPDHTCAVLADTTVACWGWDAEDQCGAQFVEDWVRLPTLIVDDDGVPFTGATQVAAGDTFSCAVSDSGQVWCWGGNGSGVPGTSTSVVVSSPHPVAIQGLTDVTRIAAGTLHACAIDGDTDLWCWGYNFDGQLGDGTTDDRYEPVLVATDVVDVGGGQSHTCLLDAQGRPFCWGANGYGQLGDGTDVPKLTPSPVAPPLSGSWPALTALGIGTPRSCGLAGDGKIYCWGEPGKLVPKLSTMPQTSLDLFGGSVNKGKCALQPDGLLWCSKVGSITNSGPVDFCGSTLLEPEDCEDG